MIEYSGIVSAIMQIMRGVDTRERQLFSDGWTDDVDFEVIMLGQEPIRVRGRENMVGKFTAGWNGEPSGLRHQVGAVDVEMLGEGQARARFYCTYVNVGDTPSLAGMGEYEDTLTKGADGRWRVACRRHRFLTPLLH